VSLGSLNDDGLMTLSRDAHLFLSLDEMKAVRDHFSGLDRDPTDLELETLAQTWSEHCVHKTLKSAYDYEGEDFGRPGTIRCSFGNLLKETIAAATKKLDRDWCLSVFVDNAGIIAFDDENAIAFKAETHNHPSAIEPYGGAATGIGGCIRDIMGCGLGAKPIASTDVFCVAPPDYPMDKLPGDVLHPRRILKGIVSGVRDYGNRMGIPTVNGAIYFDNRYLANPLVFCGCVGLIPRNRIDKKPRVGDKIVVAGGRTGRDGIHGATFSSAELTDGAVDEFSHAVQIGNAIEEKKLLDAQLVARDMDDCLYSAVTDCGAGGLSSAVGEMGEETGAVVDLTDVPLKYSGLRYDEIWISEAQERMVFAVPPENLERFMETFENEDVESTVIGEFTGDGQLRVQYQGQLVGELDMRFLHGGIPRSTLKATWTGGGNSTSTKDHAVASDVAISSETLLDALRDLNVASKEWVIRQYDHEVQGRSVVKPLVGPRNGPSDAAVIRPVYASNRGMAVACGLCPHLGDDDPYWMAVAAVDEALRNVICVGADPLHTAILDNFCWPKVDSEESLGALVRTCRGAHDAAMAYGLPFISGKDSLNNEFTMSEEEAERLGLPRRIAIPPTLLISAVGKVADVERCVTMDFKRSGDVVAIVSAPVMDVGLEAAWNLHQKVSGWIRGGIVSAAHDVSDGGLGVALAEMCIASGLGAAVSLDSQVVPQGILAEIPTTYVMTMSREDAESKGVKIIGTVTETAQLIIERDGRVMADMTVDEMSDAWRSPLAEGGGHPHG
jgi:phosphoribosylformylglycinamidine synthase